MKPILKDITIRDIDKYKEVIKRCKVKDVVVGSIFKEDEISEEKETVHFSDKNQLFYKPDVDQEEYIIKELMELDGVRVASRSSHIMGIYKGLNKRVDDERNSR